MYTYQSDRICINTNGMGMRYGMCTTANLRDVRFIGDRGERIKDIHDGGGGYHF
jgi:hypothetical protein